MYPTNLSINSRSSSCLIRHGSSPWSDSNIYFSCCSSSYVTTGGPRWTSWYCNLPAEERALQVKQETHVHSGVLRGTAVAAPCRRRRPCITEWRIRHNIDATPQIKTKFPIKSQKFKIVLEISSWSHFSYNFTLNNFSKACIPLKWIFSEICDMWYWHELLMGQMLVASDQKYEP